MRNRESEFHVYLISVKGMIIRQGLVGPVLDCGHFQVITSWQPQALPNYIAPVMVKIRVDYLIPLQVPLRYRCFSIALTIFNLSFWRNLSRSPGASSNPEELALGSAIDTFSPAWTLTPCTDKASTSSTVVTRVSF